MADSKITALTALTAADPANDMMPIVDVSDTSMAASGTTKRISINNILACSPSATLASATITGDLTVASSILKVTGGNVGINTASPTNTSGYKTLEIVGTGVNTGGMIRMKSSDASVSSYDFVDNNGRGIFAVSNHNLRFGCNDIEQYRIQPLGIFTWSDGAGGTRMTLNSTGLGVGVASPSYNIHARGTTDGRLQIEGASGYGMVFIQASSGNSAQLQLNSNGGSGRRYVVASNTSGQFLIGDETAVQTRLLIDSTGQVGIGVTPSAGKGCLQLSSGINFPATQVASSDANTLDDYKEATWSPVITAGSGTPTTVTVNSAVYTKVGRVVVCTFDFSIVNKGTASSSLQFGLPVTSITSTAFCGSFREDGSTGSMGMVIYSTGTTAGCLLYNNATPWVDGYRLKGTYTYFAA